MHSTSAVVKMKNLAVLLCIVSMALARVSMVEGVVCSHTLVVVRSGSLVKFQEGRACVQCRLFNQIAQGFSYAS
jgi:hypothetical protein